MGKDRVDSLREQIRSVGCPGTNGSPYVPIVRARKEQVSRGYFTGDGLLGVLLHWDRSIGRQLPCRRVREDCRFCLQGQPVQWKGYGSACIWPARSRRVVEVPEGAYRACPLLVEKDGLLRGWWWELVRFPGPSNCAPVKITIRQGAPLKEIEEPFDVLAALIAVWGLQDRPREAIHATTLAQRMGGGLPGH